MALLLLHQGWVLCRAKENVPNKWLRYNMWLSNIVYLSDNVHIGYSALFVFFVPTIYQIPANCLTQSKSTGNMLNLSAH